MCVCEHEYVHECTCVCVCTVCVRSQVRTPTTFVSRVYTHLYILGARYHDCTVLYLSVVWTFVNYAEIIQFIDSCEQVGTGMASLCLGLVVEDEPSEHSCDYMYKAPSILG